VSQQSEHQRRDRLQMGILVSRLYSILVEPIRSEQFEVHKPNVSAHRIETSVKTMGSFRAISGWQTRTGGYRLLEAPLRLEPQSRHYAGMLVAQTR
jgi:hypothetical protein